MLWKLFLAMTIIPAVELFLLLQIGAYLGPLQTFAIIVLTGMVGAWLAKREGFGVLMGLRNELAEGLPPGGRLAEGALVVVGGILLLTPGVLTDLTGFLFIAPPTRRWLAPHVVNAVLARVDFVSLGDPSPQGRPSNTHRSVETNKPFASPFDDLP